MTRQSSMSTFASRRVSKASTERTSSRTFPPKDSTYGFSQGEPGSM